MTVTDQIKILNRKIKQNESQYDLDRKAAEISALSPKNLDKYELLTGEDLDLKPSTVAQVKFEYFPLGKIFNKGLSQEDKKEGLFKRLENIKDKNEELINTLSATNKAPKNKTNIQSKKLIYDVNHSFAKLRNIDDIKKLSLDSMFNLMKEYHKKFNSLNKLKPQKENNKKRKQEVLTNVGDIYNELHDIYKSKYNKKINSLNAKSKKKLDYKKLRLSDNYLYSSEEEEQDEKQDEKTTKADLNEFNEQINKKATDINMDLFKKYFYYQTLSALLKNLHITNNEVKNALLKSVINSGIKDLNKEIKNMPKEEKEIEKPDKISKIVEEILKFNKQTKEGKGLKILTPNQMLTRLPITLAQLKAGYNSEKLKNEIRELLYSLYRSKNMTKRVYNNLINYP